MIILKQEVQIVQVLLLGEEERGQKPYQILCFINHIHANEFISPDAMSKLRQVIILIILFLIHNVDFKIFV